MTVNDDLPLAGEAAGPDLEADEAIATLAACLADRLERHERRDRVRRWLRRFGTTATLLAGGWFGHTAYEARLGAAGKLIGGEGVEQPPDAKLGVGVAVPRFLADAAGAHSLFAEDRVHPVEFTAAAEGVMQAWFSSHLEAPVEVPHLENVGFDLVGGRLLGTAEGPIAQLIYTNPNNDKVSVFFARRPDPAAAGPELKLVRIGQAYASWWHDGGLGYAVVEASPGADVGVVATRVSEFLQAKLAP